MVGSAQPQIGDAIPYQSGQGIEFNSGQSATTASATSTVQQPTPVNQYGQAPLPQRSQPQQLGQAPPPAAQPPLSQPPLEPTSAANSTTVMEQPPRPTTPDKTSPAPSDDHEGDTVETGSSSWAARVKQKPAHRSPHQSAAALQQPQHVAQTMPGPSAPAMLSPTGAVMVRNQTIFKMIL